MAYRLIDPNEDLDYTCGWSDWLDDSGSPSDTIISSVWSIDPDGSPGPTLHDDTFTVNSASTFISGCILGEVYLLSNRITTAVGRAAERSITLRCETR